uniref:mitogen-activated protein kinase kinase n=1 Tax=Guillardia theta TaxID=55529 RepID=A0A7S4KXN7_GUITH
MMSKKRMLEDDDDRGPDKRRNSLLIDQETRSYQRMYVACVNACIDQNPPPTLVMVLEAQDTNLHQISSKIMPEAVMSTVIHQVLQALFYVHKLGIIHGGIDATAVYIAFNGKVRLGNFYNSSYADQPKCRGKLELMAPERMLGIENTLKSDIWSLGVMMFKILTGQHEPFGKCTNKLQYKENVLSRDALRLPWNGPFTPALQNFVEKSTSRNVGKRPTVAELLDMPFVGKALGGVNGKRTWPTAKTSQSVLASWVQNVLTGGVANNESEETVGKQIMEVLEEDQMSP